MVDNQASVIVKPEATSAKHINNTINLNPVKPSDRTPKTTIVKNPGIVKRNSLPSPPRSRKPSLRRKDSVKINMEVTKDRPSLESNNNKIISKSKISKPLHYMPKDSLPETTLKEVQEVLNEVKSSQSLKLVDMTGSMTKASDAEDREGAMSSNYYMNAYIEKPSIAVNPDIDLSGNVNRQGGAHELFDESHQFFVHDCDKLDNIEESKMTIGLKDKGITINPPLMEHGFSSPIVTEVTQTQPKNDVALNNKEGTVNLKLNIEIWNYSNDIKNIPPLVSERESLILLKREKGSQFDVKEKSLEHDKPIANNMSDEENHKVIIVKCACMNQDGEKTKIPVNVGNSNLLVFLPILKLDENCKR